MENIGYYLEQIEQESGSKKQVSKINAQNILQILMAHLSYSLMCPVLVIQY